MSAASTGRTRAWIGVGVSALLLLVGSAIPLPARHRPTFGPYGPDRFLHLVGHAGLTATLVAALDDGDGTGRPILVAVALSTLYGLATELLQERVPGREFERGDLVAALLGSVLGGVVRPRSRPRRRSDAVRTTTHR